MNYDELEIKLAFNECEKAFLLEDARYELEKLGDTFYEEEESSGLIGKVKKLIKTVREWFAQHFGKKKELKVSKENAPKVKKAHSLLSKLKSNAKNPKVWAALIALTAGGTILATTGVTTKRMYDSKKEKAQIKENSNNLENMVKTTGKSGEPIVIGYFDAGEACDVIVEGLDRLYKNKEISYKEYRDRLRAINITLGDLHDELKKGYEENKTFKDVNLKRALIHNQREAHAVYKKKGAKPTDTGNKELMKMQSKMSNIDKHLRQEYDDSDLFDED